MKFELYKLLSFIIINFFLLNTSVSVIHSQNQEKYTFQSKGNPIITHKYTADPAVLLVGDTLWLFTGEDAGPDLKVYDMINLSVFSTTHPVTLT